MPPVFLKALDLDGLMNSVLEYIKKAYTIHGVGFLCLSQFDEELRYTAMDTVSVEPCQKLVFRVGSTVKLTPDT